MVAQVRSGPVISGPVREREELMAVFGQCPVLQELTAHGLIDLLATAIVRGNNDGVLRPRGIVSGDCANAVDCTCNLNDAALLGEKRDSLLSHSSQCAAQRVEAPGLSAA